jgi:hypothetical protein
MLVDVHYFCSSHLLDKSPLNLNFSLKLILFCFVPLFIFKRQLIILWLVSAILESSLDHKKGISCGLYIRILEDFLAMLLVKKVKWWLGLCNFFTF